MLRTALLVASRSALVHRLVARGPTRAVVDRFVAGTTVDDALGVARGLVADRLVTIDHLGENTTDRDGATATVAAYRTLLARLRDEGLAGRVEVSVKLSALGQALPRDPGVDPEAITLEHARQVCEAAAGAGTTVTVDMEDHTTTDATLATVAELRRDFGWVGAVVQSQLRRTEADCRALAGPGSRVRLCKGAYDEPVAVAYRDAAGVDASYVRCLKILMAGEGLPMVATHDPRLIAIARHLGRGGEGPASIPGDGSRRSRRGGIDTGSASDRGAEPGREPTLRRGRDYELQMLYGVRPRAQVDLAAQGERLRVYLPYGADWYGYFMRRLAERPANVAFFLRSLLTRG